MAISKDRIEIIEIVEVQEQPGRTASDRAMMGPFWKVSIGFKEENRILLQGAWYLPKSGFPDSSVLPLARSFFHQACRDAAAATAEWLLDGDQFEAMKRHPHTNDRPV